MVVLFGNDLGNNRLNFLRAGGPVADMVRDHPTRGPHGLPPQLPALPQAPEIGTNFLAYGIALIPRAS